MITRYFSSLFAATSLFSSNIWATIVIANEFLWSIIGLVCLAQVWWYGNCDARLFFTLVIVVSWAAFVPSLNGLVYKLFSGYRATRAIPFGFMMLVYRFTKAYIVNRHLLNDADNLKRGLNSFAKDTDIQQHNPLFLAHVLNQVEKVIGGEAALRLSVDTLYSAPLFKDPVCILLSRGGMQTPINWYKEYKERYERNGTWSLVRYNESTIRDIIEEAHKKEWRI